MKVVVILKRPQQQLWNVSFGILVASLLLVLTSARTLGSEKDHESGSNTDWSDLEGVKGSTELVKQVNSSLGLEVKGAYTERTAHILDITLKPENSSETVFNKTALTTTNTTEYTPTDENSGGLPSRFNYAIFAALGALIVIVLVCLKCCKWFRAYTKSGDKDDSTPQYAAILYTGDEEYGHIDIQSETASTTYQDTISSYHSLLKQNGNDSNVTPSRSPKFAFSRENSGSPRKENGRLVFKDWDMRYMELKQIKPGIRAETPDTCSPRSESTMSDNLRTFSVSSEETEPSTATSATSNNEDLNNKKPQKAIKVSFTANTATDTNKIERQRSFIRASIKHPSTERHHRSMSCRANTTRLSDLNPSAFRLKPINQGAQSAIPSSGIDVATQTNKSFTYSRWKSRKRHYSDSGVDEMVGPPTINELSSVHVYSDNCGHTCAPLVSGNTDENSQINAQSDKNRIPSTFNGEMNAKRLTSQTSITESESSDEVFAPDVPETAGMKDRKHVHDNNNSCECVSKTGHTKGDIPINKRYAQNSRNTQSSNLPTEPDAVDRVVKYDVSNYIYSTSGQSGDSQMQEHINHCKECFQKRTHNLNMRPKSWSKSGTASDMFLIEEDDVITTDKNFVDIGTYPKSSKNIIPVNVCTVQDGVSRLTNAVNGDHTLVIEQDLTSSMTSLESSGYAEISSDASSS